MNSRETHNDLYLCLISVHGLIRGEDLELGCDADTGGQTRYVVELARELGKQPEVGRVELVTRRIRDRQVAADYAIENEPLGGRASIVRLDAGPREYLPKEQLWPYLDALVDNLTRYLRRQPRLPDLLHSHYADAGYVGSQLSARLGIPLVHTGHSLGRVKAQRLRAAGMTPDAIEASFNMARRIEAEEATLAASARVLASTKQEVTEQHGLYEHFCPERMVVVPPGTDLASFHPPTGDELDSEVAHELGRFLRSPELPLVLVLARPVPRKNLLAQVEAFGAHPTLRERANLVLVAGTRDAVDDLNEPACEVLTDIIHAIDRYDLYGHVALPKQIAGDDVATLIRLATVTRGVHLNAALTEPFGLTLLEAAASGLPIIATSDGGPRDIIANCNNGLLVDPLDQAAIGEALVYALDDPTRWTRWSEQGLAGVRAHYSWAAHVRRYLGIVGDVLAESRRALPARLHDEPRADQEPIKRRQLPAQAPAHGGHQALFMRALAD